MIGCVTPPDALPNRKFRSLVPDVVPGRTRCGWVPLLGYPRPRPVPTRIECRRALSRRSSVGLSGAWPECGPGWRMLASAPLRLDSDVHEVEGAV